MALHADIRVKTRHHKAARNAVSEWAPKADWGQACARALHTSGSPSGCFGTLLSLLVVLKLDGKSQCRTLRRSWPLPLAASLGARVRLPALCATLLAIPMRTECAASVRLSVPAGASAPNESVALSCRATCLDVWFGSYSSTLLMSTQRALIGGRSVFSNAMCWGEHRNGER